MGAPRIQCRWWKRLEFIQCEPYRIYIRSKDNKDSGKSRGFNPIGYYCPGHKIFYPDKAVERNKKYHGDTYVERKYNSDDYYIIKARFKGHKITHKEAGLRTRLRNLKSLYENQLRYYWSERNYDDNDFEGLIREFLNLPPNIMELRLNSQNQYKRRGWIPHPDKPGWMKYDAEGYKKLVRQDMLKQQEMMRQIIDSRKIRA